MNEIVYKKRPEKISHHMEEAGLNVLLLTKPSTMLDLAFDRRCV